MKIAINARFLTKPYTGIGQYTKNLLTALAEIDKKNEYFLVMPSVETCQRHVFTKMHLGSNFQFITIPEIAFGSAGVRKTWWEQIQINRFFKKTGIDIAHFLYPANPWHLVSFKTIVTVHDAIPWQRSAYRGRFLSRLYQNKVLKNLPRADLIMTVSNYVKADLLSLNKSLTDKVTSVYNAASPIFSKGDSAEDLKQIQKKYHLTKKFLLYVGGYDERKNVGRLILAYRQFVAAENIDLVCVGGKALNSQLYRSFDLCKNDKSDIIKTSGKIILPGFVPDDDLRKLYKSCLAFVNISEAEGFNIPVIEAASAGCPLVISDIPVHREIVGDQALYVDPLNVSSIGEGLKKIIFNATLRQSLSQKSLDTEKKYSWTKSANQVLECYEKLSVKV